MLAVLTLLFTLYLSAALLRKRRPREAERRATMCGFCLLAPAMIGQLPVFTLPVLCIYFAAYLHWAR